MLWRNTLALFWRRRICNQSCFVAGAQPRKGGPCHNFESLYTVSQAEALSEEFQNVDTQDTLDSCWKKIKIVFNHWDELVASCKTATNELRKASAARSSTSSGKKPKAGVKGKAAPKPKAKPVSLYQLVAAFPDGCQQIAKYDSKELPASHDMQKPCVLKMLDTVLAHVYKKDKSLEPSKLILEEIDEFSQKFAASDLRFTAGKAQRPLKEHAAKAVAECFLQTVAGHDVADVGRWLPPSAFCTVAAHRSMQYEVNGIGCLRFCFDGSRAWPLITLRERCFLQPKFESKQQL